MTEDEMVGWHHGLSGLEFEQAPGVGDGQGILVHCSLRGLQRITHKIDNQTCFVVYLLELAQTHVH